MTVTLRFQAGARDKWRPLVRSAACCAWVLLASGCALLPARRSPARATIHSATAVVPATIVANLFLIESAQIDGRVRRFMIDTGSTATLVSVEVAEALGRRERAAPRNPVRVRSAHGGELALESTTLRRLQIGEAKFERVPALIYDFSDLSAHLGLRIDGLIGFPAFRDTLLTLDYPGARLIVSPHPAANLSQTAPTEGVAATLAFNNEQNTPLIPVQMGNESFVVLIDTGSDAGLNLNPTGLHPRFAVGPRPGTVVSSLAGDRQQLVGRLEQDVLIGNHLVREPVVDLTDQLSAIGGELLRHFIITFDQRRNQVTFARASNSPVTMEPRRSTGLAFFRAAIYWRVMSIVPDTPTTELGIQSGDLVVRINGEPVDGWNHERYARLLASAERITYTFLSGTREFDLEIPVFELVP